MESRMAMSLIGGGYQIWPAVRYGETERQADAARPVRLLLGLGAGAGTVWMLGELCPAAPPASGICC